jgi:hypothetical protein
MKTLQEILGKPVLFHRVGWHGKSTPNLAGYDSRIQLSYGLNSPFIAESALEMRWGAADSDLRPSPVEKLHDFLFRL